MSDFYSASRIFTGEEWLNDYAICCDDGVIRELLPVKNIPAGMIAAHFPEAFIAPAFTDLQHYGAGGRLLAVYPEATSLFTLMDHCRKGGTTCCVPTVATNTMDVFYRAIDALRAYWNQGGSGIPGLHLEGPWINPEKRGAHIASLIHPPNADEVARLLEYGKGVIRMITLAPEVCSDEILATLRAHGIIISAGHSNATYAEAKHAFTRGVTAVTHLFNAMSPFQHRAPGLAGAAMDDESVMASIIPDGYHVDFAAIRVAKKVMKERLFVITDAVTETNEGYYPHQLAGDKYESGGILSGSALTMMRAVQNLVNFAGIEPGEAIRMCSLYPARVLGMEHQQGRLAPGYKSEMVIISNDMELVRTIRYY